ncbi:MAG: tetratricopeptide repeat protein [Bacteroidales bacterium]
MNKKLYLPLLMALVLAFTSCSKKMGELDAKYFTVNPSPLVAVGGEVPATISGTFPEKYFNKKSVVTVTPVLVYAGGEAVAAPFIYQGEKVTGNDQTISYKMGGNITMKTSFKYIPAMRQSELYLAFSVKRGKKTYTLPRVKVADGVIATSALATANGIDAAIAPDQFQRIITDNYVAKILFLIQQSNLRNKELTSAQMKEVKDKMKAAEKAENQRLAGINVASTASPDGAYELNEKLAENREKNTVKYMERVMKQDKLLGDITAEFTPEDWAGFKELVEKSNIQDKELILRVLSMYNDPAEREKEIKNLSAAFTQLAEEILPQLRYSKVTASIETIGKSDEEIAKLAATDAKALTANELLYAATLAKTNAEKIAIYKKAIEIYPSDYRGYNNLGVVYFAEGNVNEAAAMFNKAAQVNPNAGEVAMNLGVIDMTKNDFAKAQQAFGKAAGVPELPSALGTLYTEQGDYQKAVMAFGNTKSNNAAVAQICAGDYNSAKNTLSAIANKDALTYYLMAVVGARTNNENMVSSNLKEAVKLDPSMAQFAKTDLEFAKYNVANWI